MTNAAITAGVDVVVQESVAMVHPDSCTAWITENIPADRFPIAEANLTAEDNAARFTAAGRTGVVLRRDSEPPRRSRARPRDPEDAEPGTAGRHGYRGSVQPGQRQAVNLAEKLATFDEHWSPRTIAEFNGHDVMVVKVKGEFVWHHHDDTDDFFLVLKGRLTIRMRDGDVELGPGEMFVVPVGVEHQPCAADEAELLLIEPSGTPNTGDESTAARRIIA